MNLGGTLLFYLNITILLGLEVEEEPSSHKVSLLLILNKNVEILFIFFRITTWAPMLWFLWWACCFSKVFLPPAFCPFLFVLSLFSDFCLLFIYPAFLSAYHWVFNLSFFQFNSSTILISGALVILHREPGWSKHRGGSRWSWWLKTNISVRFSLWLLDPISPDGRLSWSR